MLDAAFDHVTEFQRWSNPAHYDTDFLEKDKKKKIEEKWIKN